MPKRIQTNEPKKGRPKDAKGRHYVTAIAVVSRCPKLDCLSTERSAYTKTEEISVIGEENGMPYNTVIWRTCQCLSCGQWRRDRSIEFRRSTTKPTF